MTSANTSSDLEQVHRLPFLLTTDSPQDESGIHPQIVRLQDQQSTFISSTKNYFFVSKNKPQPVSSSLESVFEKKTARNEARTLSEKTEEIERDWVNSTSHHNYLILVIREANKIFDVATEEYFEDGMETEFSRAIVSLVEKYKSLAIEALGRLIKMRQLTPQLVSESLRWIGWISDKQTHNERRRLLEDCLFHKSPYIRDGAIIGLAYLDDPKSIKPLVEAAARENIPPLSKYIQQVIEQLRGTQLETG